MRKGLRDTLVFVVVVGALLGGLYAYAGVWPPAVIVESSSMMHREGSTAYGRIGTIDPGDIVVVKAVHGVDEVATMVEGGTTRYGNAGDVLVYFPANDRASTPIIHRAVAFIEVGPESYRVRWDATTPCVGGAHKDAADARWCVYGATGVTLPQFSLQDYRPKASGFVTKGDNPLTNPSADVENGISHDASGAPSIVRPEWVQGKARGELPWLGLLKLAVSGHDNERDPPASYVHIGWAYAPPDLWVMLALTLVVVIGGPFAWDAIQARRHARDRLPKR